MDFQSAMETFAEAWVAANAGAQTQALALTRPKTPKKEMSHSPPSHPHHQQQQQSEAGDKSADLTSPKLSISQNLAQSISLENPNHPNFPITLAQNFLNCKVNPTTISNNNNNNIHSSNNNNNNNSTASAASNNGNNSHENGGNSAHHMNNGPIPSSPSVERKEFDFSKVNAKSLPLHCVVESVSSLQSSIHQDSRNPWKRRSNTETDSYVIIPAITPFCEIVNTAMQRLGYSHDVANTARGQILIKNWKPLPLEKISDNPLVSVSDILGELTSVVTLKITILRSKPTQLAEIKDKLLKLLILQSHAVLRSTGCPLDEITLSQICRSPLQNNFPFGPDISDDLRRKFDQWWATQLTPQANPMAHKILPFVNPPTPEFDFPSVHSLNNVNREALLDSAHHANHHNMIVHPALQTVHSQYPNQKTRMRTSFDPEMELPKLQRWFHENPHPSRQQIQTYVVQLNSLESRRGRKPLDVNNVVYWFKNARAAQKRAEMRGQSLTNGYAGPGIMMPHAEYMKSSPSAPSDDIDNISQHSDDMDDEMDRPSSPLQVPLSLTMHERNRSPVNDDTPTKSDQGFKLEDTDDRASKSPALEKSENIINNNDGTAENHNSDDHNDDGDQSSKNHCDDISKSNFSCERASTPQQLSPKSEDLDVDEPDDSNLEDYRSPSPDSRRLSFPMSNSISNSMFSHSIMYMSHYIPTMANQQQQQQQQQQPGQLGNSHHGLMSPSASGLNLSSFSNDERRKRNRTFIDPVTEVPKLEQWFSMNTHPSHNMILKYTEDLNRMPYRQKFPRLESKNVQFWFKNRRAKCKRLKMSLYDTSPMGYDCKPAF